MQKLSLANQNATLQTSPDEIWGIDIILASKSCPERRGPEDAEATGEEAGASSGAAQAGSSDGPLPTTRVVQNVNGSKARQLRSLATVHLEIRHQVLAEPPAARVVKFLAPGIGPRLLNACEQWEVCSATVL